LFTSILVLFLYEYQTETNQNSSGGLAAPYNFLPGGRVPVDSGSRSVWGKEVGGRCRRGVYSLMGFFSISLAYG
jgi:hypothetical protein